MNGSNRWAAVDDGGEAGRLKLSVRLDDPLLCALGRHWLGSEIGSRRFPVDVTCDSCSYTLDRMSMAGVDVFVRHHPLHGGA